MIIEQIDQDLKSALKEKNETVVSALRNLKAAAKNVEIEKKSALTDDDLLKVLAKKVKQHKDSIESFVAGSRQDLADVEMAQMKVLEKYLPAAMSEDEARKIVKETVASMNATSADFGKVMKEAMAKAQGRADGTVISKLVKEELKS